MPSHEEWCCRRRAPIRLERPREEQQLARARVGEHECDAIVVGAERDEVGRVHAGAWVGSDVLKVNLVCRALPCVAGRHMRT